jgi:germination protein M
MGMLAAWLFFYARANNANAFVRLPVYYYSETQSTLEREERSLPAGESLALLDGLLAAMYEPPRNTALRKLMPETEGFMSGYVLNGNMLEVSFSPAYYTLPPLEEALFRAAFIWTVTGLPYIDQVRFTVDGDVWAYANRENVDISPIISPERITTRTFVLYFINETADAMLPQARTTGGVNLDQLERYIVQLLIDGPGDMAGHISAIPIETKIRDIRTEDGICYVNLSAEFNSKFSGSPGLARLALYCIIHSLTDNINNVRRVQFLIEGEKHDQFQGVLDFNRPFEKDETLLQSETTEEE